VTHDLAVLTPEKTIITYRLAGLGSRVLAHFIDVLIFGTSFYFVAVGVGIASIGRPAFSEMLTGIVVIGAYLGPFLYFMLFEGFWNGQTPGKKMAGIRVRMADGTPITFGAATARNFLRVADILPGTYFVGIISMFVNAKFQRIGDLVANTIVTIETKKIPNFTISPHRAGVHPLENLVGELRNMTDDQYQVLRRYCDRYPELSNETQDRLTAEVWLPIATKIGVNIAADIHPLYLAEATVMKYGRVRGLL
jgi:uncharacterized RDD family membrane protein YckC